MNGRATEGVFDASVILAIIQQEPGYEEFLDMAFGGLTSTVNLAEARGKLSDRGLDRKAIDEAIGYINLSPIAFDEEQAQISSDLRPSTKMAGLSLADRACIALAVQRSAIVYTADQVWAEVKVPVEIKLIR